MDAPPKTALGGLGGYLEGEGGMIKIKFDGVDLSITYILTIYNNNILVRSIIKFWDRNFLLIDKVQANF